MNARGSVFKYPDNVDTDVIIPARHLNTQDAKELASHCMEDIDKDFVKNVKDGDIILMHELYGATGDAVARIVPELHKRGFQMVTVSQMAAAKGRSLEAGKLYSSFH